MGKMVLKYKWSLPIRINHWLTAFAIFVLIGTGFFIAYPVAVTSSETVNKFSVGYVRYAHILFGVLVTFAFFWRIYLAFFSKFNADWKDFFAWAKWRETLKQVRFYLCIDKKEPGHHGTYGPIQSLAYLGLMFMLLCIVITGLILMGAGYDSGLTALVYVLVKPLENMLGGLATVRYIHHILTWAFVLFVVVHIYMAFWYDLVVKNRTLLSMFDGNLLEHNE